MRVLEDWEVQSVTDSEMSLSAATIGAPAEPGLAIVPRSLSPRSLASPSPSRASTRSSPNRRFVARSPASKRVAPLPPGENGSELVWQPASVLHQRPSTTDGLPMYALGRAEDSGLEEVASLPDLRSGDDENTRIPSQDISLELRRSAIRLLGGVARRAAAVRVEECPETFLCLVCFENWRVDRRLVLAECTAASHGCCLECAANFFRSRILQGRVLELPCPIGAADGGCRASDHGAGGSSAGSGEAGADAPPEANGAGAADQANASQEVAWASRGEVETCLAGDHETLVKYRRFLQTKVDPSLRECPDCKRLSGPTLDPDTGRPQSGMTCSSCGSVFCYFHAAAHRGGSCEEYEMRVTAETRGISEAFGAKDCPRCERQTMKSGGCNHMTCQVCRCEWCWICGDQLVVRGPHGESPIYWHYSEENVDSGCQQFADAGQHPDTEEVRLRRRDRAPGPLLKRLSMPVGALSVALLALATLLALSLWLLLYSVSCCVAAVLRTAARVAYRCRSVDPPDAFGEACARKSLRVTLYCAVACGTVIFFVPFFVVIVAWEAIAVVLWVVLAIVGRLPIFRRYMPALEWHHLRFLTSAPWRAVHRFCSSVLTSLADANPDELGDEDFWDDLQPPDRLA